MAAKKKRKRAPPGPIVRFPTIAMLERVENRAELVERQKDVEENALVLANWIPTLVKEIRFLRAELVEARRFDVVDRTELECR